MERSASNRFRSRLSTIKVGSRVKINTGRHAGKLGHVESWNVEKMKWKVKLDGSSTSRHFMSSSLEAYKGNDTKKSNDDVLGVLSAASSSEKKQEGRKRVLSEKGRSAIQSVLNIGSKSKSKKGRRQTVNFSKLAVARRTTKSDGTVLEVLEDNTLRANFKDGTVVIKASDRKVTTRPDGTRVVLFTPPMNDGLKKLTKFTDGCVIQNFEDGREVQIEPDGTIVQTPTSQSSSTNVVAPPPPQSRQIPTTTSTSSSSSLSSTKKKKSVQDILSSANRSSLRKSKGPSVGEAFSKQLSSTNRNRLSTSSTSSVVSTNSTSSSGSFSKPKATGRRSRRGVRGGLRLISQRKIRKDASWLRKKSPKQQKDDDDDEEDEARVVSLNSSAPKLGSMNTKDLASAVSGAKIATTQNSSPAVNVAKRAAAKRRLTEEMETKRKEEEEKRRREKRSAAAAAAKREEERKRKEQEAALKREREREERMRKAQEEARRKELSARKALEEQRERDRKAREERDRKAREERDRERKAREQARIREMARLAEEKRRKEESERRMKREKEEKLAAEKRAKEVLKRRDEARKKAEEKQQKAAASKTTATKKKAQPKKAGKASKWPWSSFHFDNEVDCKEFVPDTYHRKFPARMCKACGNRLGKHHIEAVKKKEHVLKAVEAGPMASRCWIHPQTEAILYVGGYRSVASKFCANEKIKYVLTVAHGLKKRYAKFARAVAKAEAAKTITFLNLDWEDSQTQELSEEDLFKAFKFMHQQLESGHHVLVHCAAGQSRSGTIAAAYLVAFHKLSASKALHYVKQRRTIIDPNKGFRDKLKKLDKDGTFKKIAAKVTASM